VTRKTIQLKPVKPYQWRRVIRWLHLSNELRYVKLVAHTLADYADYDDGTKVHPGEKRLAAETGYSDRHVRTALAWLRGKDAWLLYRHSSGSNLGHSNAADLYQLCIPEDWRTRLPLGPTTSKEGNPWDT
jgi:hypothetical protein